MRIRANAARTVAVRDSPRRSTPAVTATAGLTYVMTLARVGPTSLISSRKATNAIAVQTAPRPARAVRAPAEGSSAGRVMTAAGA
ncbi:hypothetical protein A4U61_22170 [Streptomyces sp. H-KF8]|nr:hypothetical protein [Streptomyces sp. H-KF8]OBQ47951.1 hypothetical protein A4U61_22170 [Streptomyces sp. H-KF8]